jgi:hypothetical protein
MKVNADKIYTSKEFKRIKDNFQVSERCTVHSVLRDPVLL